MVDLYMQPAEMAAYQAAQGGVKSTPLAKVSSKMEEGQYFATRDEATCQALNTYITACNQGLDGYTNQAHVASNQYVGTDAALAADFNYLTDKAYSAEDFNRANATGERPAGIPDRLRIDPPPGFEWPAPQ